MDESEFVFELDITSIVLIKRASETLTIEPDVSFLFNILHLAMSWVNSSGLPFIVLRETFVLEIPN